MGDAFATRLRRVCDAFRNSHFSAGVGDEFPEAGDEFPEGAQIAQGGCLSFALNPWQSQEIASPIRTNGTILVNTMASSLQYG